MIGVAMIARNAATQIPTALYPFAALGGDVGIVLGGQSDDDTAEIAKRYATRLAEYDGPIADDGSLLDFAAARQQSFDLVTNDWVIVVDTDDEWAGVENLPAVVANADEAGAVAIRVPYRLPHSTFLQPRIFRRDAGQWTGAIHESFVLGDGVTIAKTSDLSVQQTTIGKRLERKRQNVRIGEEILQREPNNLRTMAHLVLDYYQAGEIAKALEMSERYLDLEPEPNEQTQHVLRTRTLIFLNEGHDQAAIISGLQALAGADTGPWAMLAEAVSRIAGPGAAMPELAIWLCDRAMAQGKPRGGYTSDPAQTTTLPCLIKAKALLRLGRHREALAAVDLGLEIDPANQQLKTYQRELCAILDEVI